MLQIVTNAIVSASHLLLLGVALGLIYRTSRFLDISFGGSTTCACYISYYVLSRSRLGLTAGMILGVLGTICIAIGIHLTLFRNGRVKSNADSPLRLLIVSLGVYVVLQNVIALVFGNDPKLVQNGPVLLGYSMSGIYISGVQLLTVVVGSTLFCGVLLLIQCTRFGQSVRAVASDPSLAAIVGIHVEKVKLWTVGIGSGLGAVAGILSALDTSMTPTMGFRLLLNGMIVMVIGGTGSTMGLVAGALLLAGVQNFTAYFLGNKWMDAAAFLILIGFLLCRPLGFTGQRLKKVEV